MSDRLMDGESSESRSAADCAHWIGAYRELLTFKDNLLSNMDEQIKTLSRPASAEIKELDVGLVELQRERYLRGLDFWLQRQDEINLKPAATA